MIEVKSSFCFIVCLSAKKNLMKHIQMNFLITSSFYLFIFVFRCSNYVLTTDICCYREICSDRKTDNGGKSPSSSLRTCFFRQCRNRTAICELSQSPPCCVTLLPWTPSDTTLPSLSCIPAPGFRAQVCRENPKLRCADSQRIRKLRGRV